MSEQEFQAEVRVRATDFQPTSWRRYWVVKLIALLPFCRVIWGEDGSPYLLRIYLWDWFRKWTRGRFLHYFYRGDHDRELHNHPWEYSESRILWGGYREYRRLPDGNLQIQLFLPGDRNVLTSDDYHRVELLRGGCWTLFTAGRRIQEWGFSEHPGHFESITDREARIARQRQRS